MTPGSSRVPRGKKRFVTIWFEEDANHHIKQKGWHILDREARNASIAVAPVKSAAMLIVQSLNTAVTLMTCMERDEQKALESKSHEQD